MSKYSPKRDVPDFTFELRDRLQKKGYITSISHHLHGDTETIGADHFATVSPYQHVSRTLVALYELGETTKAVFFHPTQPAPLMVEFDENKKLVRTSFIGGPAELELHAIDYPDLEGVMEDYPSTAAVWDEECQRVLFSVRMPHRPFKYIPAPLTEEEFHALLEKTKTEQLADAVEEQPTAPVDEVRLATGEELTATLEA